MSYFLLINDEVKENAINAIRDSNYGEEVTIGTPTRTRPQEKYFHTILGYLSRHTGHNMYDIKTYFKIEAGYYDTHIMGGKDVAIEWRSNKITDDEYSVLIDKAKKEAEDLNIKLPLKKQCGY